MKKRNKLYNIKLDFPLNSFSLRNLKIQSETRKNCDKMPNQFLTVKQVAKLLGVTPLTIRNWDKKGRLQAYRNPINNYRVYKVEEVEKLLGEIDESKEKILRQVQDKAKEEKEKPPVKLVIEEI